MTQEQNIASILDANKKPRNRWKFQGGSESNIIYISIKFQC